MEILRNRPEGFMVWSGDDALALPQLACGMDGVISVAANGFPSLFSKMVRYGLSQDFQSAKKLNDRLMPAYELMFQENNPAGIKAILSEMGLIAEELRLPNVPVSAALKNAIQDYLALQS
jgi:4-hydroxy-tetrahydrodipicolinate synthase